MAHHRRTASIACALALAACAPSLPSGGHYASVNGIRMFYVVRGSGPPLVLLHGGKGSGEQFHLQVPDFEMRHRLIIPDMCAQGRTGDRAGLLTYHAMAEDVVTLADQLGITRFDIMGWSDGGNTGLDLAIHHPDRVSHLVTFGANFSPDGLQPPDQVWGDTATVAAFGEDDRRDWQRVAPDPAHYREAMEKILTMWRTLPQFTPEELGSIRARALICAGEHDLIRPEHTAALAHAIPGAQVWIVPGASHGAMLEKPREVNAKVLEFLAR